MPTPASSLLLITKPPLNILYQEGSQGLTSPNLLPLLQVKPGKNMSLESTYTVQSQQKTTGARGTDHPPFSNFLFTNLLKEMK